MGLRREQGMILLVLALGALVYSGLQQPGPRQIRLVPSRDYGAETEPVIALTPPRTEVELPNRDLFLEPSESSPLPPRPLPFPDRDPLPLVALPLPTGPDPAHYDLLRIPGDIVAGVTVRGQEPSQSAPDTNPGQEPLPVAGQDREGLERTYDQVVRSIGGDVFFGILEGEDKYALAERRVFDPSMSLELRIYRRTTGRLDPRTTTFTGDEIRAVRLAQNLRNEVELRRRTLKPDLANLQERREFTEWLLQKAREESWVYLEAAAQADVMIRLSNGDLDAYRWKVRVFREQGDLEAERLLYAELPEDLQNSGFHLEGRGQLKARLGLYEDAEKDLFAALDQSPNDPLILGSTALFLLDRGRPADARPLAERALRFSNRLTTPELRMRIRTVLVATYLALGELAAATDTLTAAGANVSGVNRLRGALAYAEGDIVTAETLFRSASPESRTAVIFGLNPLLGVAACYLRAERWQDALQALESVADQAPLLRHRALSGIGLLHLRLGNFDEALAALERALTVNPEDTYSLYLKGRCLRMVGELDDAVLSLEAALRIRDDFVEALAEMVTTYMELSQVQLEREAEHLVRAMRFSDRLVELDAERSGSLRSMETQGLVHFRASDLRGARDAFTRGVQRAGSEDDRLFCLIGLSLVDYAQGRTQEARRDLDDLGARRSLGDPIREYATATIALIDEHASKEQIQDRFERDGPELGSIWATESDRTLRPRLLDGHLEFRGTFDSKSEVWVRRQGAVPIGGGFVSAAVTISERAAATGAQGFSGLRLRGADRRGGAGEPEFQVDFGLHEGTRFLRIVDGRTADPDQEAAQEPVALQVEDMNLRVSQRVELRVDPPESGGGQATLVALWNGVEVHRRPLNWLRPNTRIELYADLVVRGRRGGSELDVSFDDFRLVRRKE